MLCKVCVLKRFSKLYKTIKESPFLVILYIFLLKEHSKENHCKDTLRSLRRHLRGTSTLRLSKSHLQTGPLKPLGAKINSCYRLRTNPVRQNLSLKMTFSLSYCRKEVLLRCCILDPLLMVTLIKK